MKSPINRTDRDWLALSAVVACILSVAVLAGVVVLCVQPAITPISKTEEFKSPSAVEVAQSDIDEIERMEAGEDEPENVGHGPYGSLPSRQSWATAFRHARLKLLSEHPICEACGRGPEEIGPLNAHHVISVKRIVEEGLAESLQWDVKNLISLCHDCHHIFGHPDGYAKSNPHVRRDAAKNFDNCQNRTYAEAVNEWREQQPIPVEVAKEPKKSKRGKTPSKTTVAP